MCLQWAKQASLVYTAMLDGALAFMFRAAADTDTDTDTDNSVPPVQSRSGGVDPLCGGQAWVHQGVGTSGRGYITQSPTSKSVCVCMHGWERKGLYTAKDAANC